MTDDPGFERWIDAHGFRAYVAMCAGGTLGMAAPGILDLHEVYERERLAELVPTWWWQQRRGEHESPFSS